MKNRILFIDRDGTIIVEPPVDYQVDKLEKFAFVKGAILSLSKIRKYTDFKFVMATNPMQRKARQSFLLGMLLTLLICGVIIALLFMQIKKYQDKEKADVASQVQVYALNTDVGSGQVITSDMYSRITVNRSMVPADAIGNLDNLSVYALQDKEGNELYIKRDSEGYARKNEDGTLKLYITKYF